VSSQRADDRQTVLNAGRQAAVQRRRADADACRTRVEEVIAAMRRRKQALSDTEITKRAGVNNQYLQRHRDLRARAQAVRAELTGDRLKAAIAVRSETEEALIVENRMLVEQNARMRADLATAQQTLRELRAESLAARATGRLPPSGSDDEIRRQRDQAIAGTREAQAELVTLRNLNQRLMVENSKLLDENRAADGPTGTPT
jgi:hypothetical protein